MTNLGSFPIDTVSQILSQPLPRSALAYGGGPSDLSVTLVPLISALLMVLANRQDHPMAHLHLVGSPSYRVYPPQPTHFSEPFHLLRHQPWYWLWPSPGMDHHYFQASWNPHSSEFTLYSEVLARVLNLITWKTALKSMNSSLSKLRFWPLCSKPQNLVLGVPFQLPHLPCWSFFFGVIPFLPHQNQCTPCLCALQLNLAIDPVLGGEVAMELRGHILSYEAAASSLFANKREGKPLP